MSFAEKYFFEHKTKVGTSTTTTRIELHEDGFVGSATRLNARGDFWTHEYENLDPVDIFSEPVQKSRLEMHINIEDATDKAILEAIFAGDDDDYRLVKKVNGSIVWTGSVISDLLEYPEGGYPFEGTIIAKDLSSTEGDYYTSDGTIVGALKSGEETIITTIAELLSYTGYGLDIYTYTSWKEQNMSDSTDDFLNEVLNNVQALRTYARTGDESDEPITIFEALKKICRNYGLILRQANGAWRLYHRSALSNPTAVDEYIYDSTGTQTSKNTGASRVDISVSADRVVRYVLPKSKNKFNKGLKSTRVKYEHRTSVSGIKFPESFRLTPADLSRDFSQLIISDGSQKISISGTVKAQTDDTITDYEQWALYTLKADTYYWNATSRTWSKSFASNKIELTDTTLTGGKLGWQGYLSETTTDLPADADGPLTAELFIARNDTDGVADYSDFIDLNLSVLNAVAEENSTYIDYELFQSGAYSGKLDYGDVWYGDGPTGYSIGALKVGSTLALESWIRKGEATGVNHAELLLREILDNQRVTTRNLRADLYGSYIADKVLGYDSTYFFFLGGQQTGTQNRWDADFVEINVQTASDTFRKLPKFVSDEATGSASTGGSGGATGVTLTEGDARWFRQSNNLSEGNASAMRSNLGLVIGTDVQAWDADLDTLATNDGSNLTSLNASELDSGTVPSARISGDYTGITGVGALDTGSITDGFGSIDIGSSSLSAGNSNLAQLRSYGTGTYFFQDIWNTTLESGQQRLQYIIGNFTNAFGSGRDNLSLRHRNNDGSNYKGIYSYDFANEAFAFESDLYAFNGLNLASDSASEFITFDRTQNSNVTDVYKIFPSFFGETGEHLRITGNEVSTILFEFGLNGQFRATGISYLDDGVDINSNILLNADGTSTFGGLVTLEDDLQTDIFSDWFSANPTGFQVTQAGIGDFRTLYIDELIAKAFTAEVAQALAGADFLTKSVSTLSETFEVPYVYGVGGVNQTIGEFTINAVNVTNEFTVGSTFYVHDSTGNDGFYTVSSVNFNGSDTEVFTDEGFSDATADGVIAPSVSITVDDLQGLEGLQVFEDEDHVRFAIVDMSSGLEIYGLWGRVTNYSTNGDGTQDWDFMPYYNADRKYPNGAGQINKGAVVLDYGVSGDYYMERTVLDRSSGSDFTKVPFDRTVQWTGIDPRQGTKTVRLQDGNLNGIAGTTSPEFGFFAGDYSGGNYVKIGENSVILRPTDLLVDIEGGGSSGFGNADFYLNSEAHQISVGSVFKADGGTNSGKFANWDFDANKLSSVYDNSPTTNQVFTVDLNPASDNEKVIRIHSKPADLYPSGTEEDLFYVNRDGMLFSKNIVEPIYAVKGVSPVAVNPPSSGEYVNDVGNEISKTWDERWFYRRGHGTPTVEEQDTYFLRVPYQKKFGHNTILFKARGQAEFRNTTNWVYDLHLRVLVLKNQTAGSTEIMSYDYELPENNFLQDIEFSFDIDNDLEDEEYYSILVGFVTKGVSATGTTSTLIIEGSIREDIAILALA